MSYDVNNDEKILFVIHIYLYRCAYEFVFNHTIQYYSTNVHQWKSVQRLFIYWINSSSAGCCEVLLSILLIPILQLLFKVRKSLHFCFDFSYTVCTGIVDKLAVYCSSVHDNKSADSYFLLHSIQLLTRLVETRLESSFSLFCRKCLSRQIEHRYSSSIRSSS